MKFIPSTEIYIVMKTATRKKYVMADAEHARLSKMEACMLGTINTVYFMVKEKIMKLSKSVFMFYAKPLKTLFFFDNKANIQYKIVGENATTVYKTLKFNKKSNLTLKDLIKVGVVIDE